MTTNIHYLFEPEGDRAIIIRLISPSQETINITINDIAIRMAHAINTLAQENHHIGIIEAIPTFNTVGVYYHPEILGDHAFQKACDFLQTICKEELHTQANTASKTVEIPVCYDKEFGIDLEELSHTLQLSIEDIIQLHTRQAVRVFMLGFSPGLPYLGLFDEKLNVPRRATPRVRLEAGSIAIANRQCVIYPYETPGGWHIIGRTPLKLFDANKPPYTLYQAGDMIVFKPISKEEFLSLK